MLMSWTAASHVAISPATNKKFAKHEMACASPLAAAIASENTTAYASHSSVS